MPALAVLSVVKLVPWAKRLATVGAIGALAYGCMYFKLGELTFAQHAQRIWQTDEAIDLREGIAEKLGGAKSAAMEELKTRLAASKSSD